MPAQVLGRYRLIERIAQGGMGEVWRGVDVGYGGIERPVALKRIAPMFAGEPSLRGQFLDEARLSFLLCHQNVVQVRDIGEHEGDVYIAMEWVEGADLGTITRRLRQQANQPLPLRFACLAAVEAARGLDYAHRLRDGAGRPLMLVHRDVSPSNLLCSVEGEVKVSDFGIARSRLREQTSIPGSLKGKLGYMAPEQAAGDPLDARADVFALGAVLYELAAGANPFLYDARENEALERVRAARVRPLRAVVPTVPQGLEAIVLRAMAARRDQRYQSCAEMREDLESFARRESYALSPSDFGQFVRDLLATPTEPAAAGAPAATPVKRLSGSRAVAAPRAFNDALGGALAALGSDGSDGDGDDGSDGDGGGDRDGSDGGDRGGAAAGAHGVTTAPGFRAPRPRTVALPQAASPVGLHRPIEVPPAAPDPDGGDARPRPPTDLTDLIPRSRSRAPIALALAAAALALVAGAAWLAVGPPRTVTPARTPSPAGTNPELSTKSEPSTSSAPSARSEPGIKKEPGSNAAPGSIAAPGANAAPGTDPAAGTNSVLAPAAGPARDRHHARVAARPNEAHLSITCDVAADAFVDGELVRATPIIDLAVAPGRHVVRVESTAPGLRLIPREVTVELRAGELRELAMELK